MVNPLYNMINRMVQNNPQINNTMNIINQYKQLQNDPGMILDVLLSNGKINQQQYNDLQQYKNNPQQICNYLLNHGNANQLNQAQQQAIQFKNMI